MRKETYMRLSGNNLGIQMPERYQPSQADEIETEETASSIVKMTKHDIIRGRQVDQWTAGMAGAVCTTLPAFILMFLWAAFTMEYKVQKENGEVDGVTCFIINFVGGVLIWIAFFIFI